ncbi:hypothetical protein HPP92_001960 [Vanilla planifolia]|uniref:Uncharacterized protein n=1 Tax=Vanilla planifolia TaxID=51239 RepID=A0A835SDS0_VANPL|nr:hypothetical protein HPP92_001960 [Vanilla planifolia]
MPKTSKELLDHVETPSILEKLVMLSKDSMAQSLKSKQHVYTKPKEKPSITQLPQSQVLGKARDFIEVMAKANKDLEMRSQDNPCPNFDIEVLDDNEKEYIEMDLLLGVTDLHTEEAVAAAEASVSSSTKVVGPANGSFCIDGDDDGDDSDRNALINGGNMPSKHSTTVDESQEAKPHKRLKIVMLD